MKPQGYGEAYRFANGKRHLRSASYKHNCHYVVNAMEMRARGFDVVSAPTFRTMGRFHRSIEKDWMDPATGMPRASSRVMRMRGESSTMDSIERMTASWPPNSRGFAAGEWESGAGHIFSIYKDEKGVLRFVDGQVDLQDASAYVSRMRDMDILRVDDLEPVPHRVRRSVENEHEIVNDTTQEKRLKNFLSMYQEDLDESRQVAARYLELKNLAKELGVVVP